MTSDVTTDSALDLLSTKTRRQVVTLLLEVDGPWSIRELAAELVRLDPTVSPDGADDDTHTDRVATRLYHCDLPRLAEAGVVDVDDEELIVSGGRHLDALGAYLDDLLGLSDGSNQPVATRVSAD